MQAKKYFSKIEKKRKGVGVIQLKIRPELLFVLVALSFTVTIFSCNGEKPVHKSEEMAQQIGDVMASIDEFGGSSGALASVQFQKKMFDRYVRAGLLEKSQPRFAQKAQEIWYRLFVPEAHAFSCLDKGFSICAAGVITRNLDGCTILDAAFTGTVKLTWSNASICSMNSTSEYVTRVPDFKVTGRRDATLNVKKVGIDGQRLTWISGSDSKVFLFESDGINRTFTTASGQVLFDQSTLTISPIYISGTTRDIRKMTGGKLRVRNNVTLSFCDYAPDNVQWSAGCNCPTSGVWSGICSNSNSSTLTLTGCGTATFEDGSYKEDVIFDRCGI